MKYLVTILLSIAATIVACEAYHRSKIESKAPPLVGKGSSFVYPLMIHWSSQYVKSDEQGRIEYAPLGSSSGIKALLDNKVDFACTEAPLNESQLSQAKASGDDVLHIPLVLGAVVPIYNLPEVSETLRFSGPVLADIFLGKITMWNDNALQELNPKVAKELPAKPIAVVHRKDGSGTTYVWTEYLAKVSEPWKEKVGFGLEVAWPVGASANGSEGVTDLVKRSPGGITYVELAFAFRRELPFGLVQNQEKEFVKASFDSVGKAAANTLESVPDDMRFSLTNAPGAGSYPICGATWAVVRLHHTAEKKKQLSSFLYWTLEKGQEEADILFYHSLPLPLRQRAEKALAKML
jgi:phosphate ABC transporter phosphate-binding protein